MWKSYVENREQFQKFNNHRHILYVFYVDNNVGNQVFHKKLFGKVFHTN